MASRIRSKRVFIIASGWQLLTTTRYSEGKGKGF
jgi:hypothetical protein